MNLMNLNENLICDSEIKCEYFGEDIGQFKIEKQGNCEVHHVNEVIWD
jgi:hypothetical protein